jgi:hypothetical protein
MCPPQGSRIPWNLSLFSYVLYYSIPEFVAATKNISKIFLFRQVSTVGSSSNAIIA